MGMETHPSVVIAALRCVQNDEIIDSRVAYPPAPLRVRGLERSLRSE